ncbi:protein BCCIP, partial [Trifolium pratense]
KTLLQTYLDVEEWDLSGFVDLILEQTTVGTVVKVEDDEDEGIFALATALNLSSALSVIICSHCLYCVITFTSH